MHGLYALAMCCADEFLTECMQIYMIQVKNIELLSIISI